MNSNLMDAMLARGVGLNHGFFERAGASKFPPHDVLQIDREHYRLVLAVAGFTRDDLKITLKGELLTISGHKEPYAGFTAEVAKDVEQKVLHRGIAYRDFTSEFLIGEHVQIENAKLENGLLEIDLMRIIPEAMKLKEIPILSGMDKPKLDQHLDHPFSRRTKD